MAASGATGGDQRFRVWIRRRNEPQGPYAIRFEVAEGKGILRVARPGVLVDPPARPSGAEERLTASQVRASRFLHVWDGGRYRQGHLLARLDEARLEAMPADRWIELSAANEGTTALLVLPAEIGPDSGIVDDEPTWPRRELLASFQRELREMGERAAPEEWATEVRSVPAEARGLDLDARIPEQRSASDAFTDARTVGDMHGDGAEPPLPKRPVRADPPEPPLPKRPVRADPPEPPLPKPARAEPPEPPRPARPTPSLDDWLDANTGAAADDDRTILMPASALKARAVERVPEVGAPRAVPPGLPVMPLVDGDDDETSIEAFDASEAIEAIEAIEATGDGGFETFEAFEAIEAIEAFETVDDPDSVSRPFEALEAEGEDDVEVVDEARDGARSAARGHLVEAVTVMPEGAQELAADVAGRRPSAGPKPVAPVARDSDPLVGAHARNTTLVRHLRRLLADERVDNEALRQRVAQLEAERALLEASRAKLEAELGRRSRA